MTEYTIIMLYLAIEWPIVLCMAKYGRYHYLRED